MKLSSDKFIRRVIRLLQAWELSIRAVDSFRNSSELLDKYLDDQNTEVMDRLTSAARKAGEEITQLPSYRAFQNFRPEEVKLLHTQLDGVIENIHAAYLINFAAILEDHIKQCARVLLLDNPLLLDAQRQVPLGKLISIGSNKIITQEVERVVQSLDRKSVSERVEFFNKSFGIDFFGQPGNKLLVLLVERRNQLLHEEPGSGVSKSEAEFAYFTCLSIGTWLILQIDAVAPELVEDEEAFTTGSKNEDILQVLPALRKYKAAREKAKKSGSEKGAGL